MDNYKTIEQKLRNLEDFRGNSLTGRWERTFDSRNIMFHVYSYRTLIGLYLVEDGEHKPWVNHLKFSTTTSKHQNLIKRAWGLI